jgi:hypothetical protein
MNTVDMDVKELVSHWDVMRLIKKDLNFAIQNVTEVWGLEYLCVVF